MTTLGVGAGVGDQVGTAPGTEPLDPRWPAVASGAILVAVVVAPRCPSRAERR